MGRYSGFQVALLTLALLAVASPLQAAEKYKITSLKEAIQKGHVGPMASGLSVERTAKLDTMLLRSMVNLELAKHGVKVPVTRMSTLNVRSIASTAVNLIKNGNPGKLLVGTLVAGAIAQLPGATYDAETGQLITSTTGVLPIGEGPNDYYWRADSSPYSTGGSFGEACDAYINTIPAHPTNGRYVYRGSTDNGLGGGFCLFAPISVSHSTGQVNISRIGSSCPSGGTYNSEQRACVGVISSPFTESDYSLLEDAVVAANPAPEDVR